MTSQEYSMELGIRLVCHLEDDREQVEPLGAYVSRNWLTLRDQDSHTWWGDTHSTAWPDALTIRSGGCVLAHPLLLS